MAITAAADGSALGNPGPAGWSWYVDDEHWAAGGWPHGTNNMGELMAVIDLAESTAHLDDDLVIVCDSRYVIDAVTRWLPGWKRNSWRKADGKPVLNRELLERLDAALQNRHYRMEWVKGHAGHPLNEAADSRARAAATAYQNGAPVNTGPGWPRVPSTTTDTTAADELTLDLFDADEYSASAYPTADHALAEVSRNEIALNTRAVRSDRVRLGELLHPTFTEIGRSGRLWEREEILDMLQREESINQTITVLDAEFLSTDVILVTSQSNDDRGASLRSSVWVLHQGRWQLRFHQGTAQP